MSREKILVLTGPVHSGKTTLLKKAAASWASNGLDVGGFLTEAVRGSQGIHGYDLYDLVKGTIFPFLRKDGNGDGPVAGSFRMLETGLDRAGSILARDTSRDIMIVDEFGPLELTGGGLRPALEKSLAAGSRCLLVVRLSILEDFLKKIGDRETAIFRLDDPGSPEAITREIAAMKDRACGR